MSANYLKLKPFIIIAEGGNDAHSNDPLDKGGDTRVGVTFNTFKAIIEDDYDRFLLMHGESDDWNNIFKHFWDLAAADNILSQRIANVIVDFIWGSGRHSPSLHVEHILNVSFKKYLKEDGEIGNLTIEALNSVDEPTLFEDLVADHRAFYDAIVTRDPSQEKWINGWHNRLNNLIAFSNKAENQ